MASSRDRSIAGNIACTVYAANLSSANTRSDTVFGAGCLRVNPGVPGLIPIDVAVPGDTIDNRQFDRTHNVLAAVTDTWKLSQQRQLVFSGFFRNYALTLRSNFGDGLIQQSENRNVVGGEMMYVQSVQWAVALVAGGWLDLLPGDAPHDLDLKHIDDNGVFQPVTSNNLTLSFIEPFFAFDGSATRYLHFNLGVRQEEVWMNNQDLITPQNGFNRLSSLTLPKGTLSIIPPDRWYLPGLALSYGESFHTNDPRIGTTGGSEPPTLLAPSRAYQLVISKTLKNTQFYVTLRHVTNSLELAKEMESRHWSAGGGWPLAESCAFDFDTEKLLAGQFVRFLRSGRCARLVHRRADSRSAAPDLGCSCQHQSPAIPFAGARRVRVREGQAAGRWFHRRAG